MRKKKWDVNQIRDELLGQLPAGWSCPDAATLDQAALLMVKSRENRITVHERQQLFDPLEKNGNDARSSGEIYRQRQDQLAIRHGPTSHDAGPRPRIARWLML